MEVLVVDDERALRAALRRALALEGYEVAEAASGEDAIGALRERAVDAVILDVLMPGIDGLEVCRRLRAAGDRTPVLMLTARETVADRVAGLDAGADDYLVKPFALEELLARLRALLRRARRRRRRRAASLRPARRSTSRRTRRDRRRASGRADPDRVPAAGAVHAKPAPGPDPVA